MSHIKYHGVLWWNDAAGDWLSVCMWFGTCCAPKPRGLVCLLIVVRKESGWNMVLNAMKHVTTLTYRWALRLHQKEARWWNVRWTELELGWVVCGEWTGQSWDLRQVFQLEWVIVGGMRDTFIIKARLFVVLGGSNHWHFSSFYGVCFQEWFPDWGFEVWLLES